MLVITTTMRMVNRVHSHTTSTGPAVAFGLVFVECTASLEQRFVCASSSSNNADGSTGATRDGLLCARRKLDTSFVVVWGMTDDGGIVSGRAGECTAVTRTLLDVADNGTFRELGDREGVSNCECSLLAAVNKGAGVEALRCDKGL